MKKLTLFVNRKEVYAISVDRRNSELMLAVRANDPVHVSVDRTFGKIESAKLFDKLQLTVDDIPNSDAVVEKFLARSSKRVESLTVLEPKQKRKTMTTDSSADMQEGASATMMMAAQGPEAVPGADAPASDNASGAGDEEEEEYGEGSGEIEEMEEEDDEEEN